MMKILPLVREIYPASKFGILTVRGLDAGFDRSCMQTLKRDELEKIKVLHSGYERKLIIDKEPMCRYTAYYKQFKKTYHVLLQLESVLLKDRGIPDTDIPVEVMFLAEMKNLLLTAVHDLDKIDGSLTMCAAAGTESYVNISGKTELLTKDDLYLSDESGVISDILCGPDYRTRISGATKNALYFVYGVDGITEAQIRSHLEDIRSYISAAAKSAQFDPIEIY